MPHVSDPVFGVCRQDLRAQPWSRVSFGILLCFLADDVDLLVSPGPSLHGALRLIRVRVCCPQLEKGGMLPPGQE